MATCPKCNNDNGIHESWNGLNPRTSCWACGLAHTHGDDYEALRKQLRMGEYNGQHKTDVDESD